ncbi:7-cyano-7-deazaguanine synthase [Methanotorris igneus]|uniref:Queuosine synthesis-like protein n=1 Tax=Methanotorris igneus (strain DSM 5666 / JCM 11834 / Kol 5) TaxID=880724 RepID=F6BEV5_METIK|nr:7-cyano-7-deazaguanine synthase [Methanotorris igneus]AEF95691.1 Queuosine synthesis-like protein [Methanotorris igneus Kol 5]
MEEIIKEIRLKASMKALERLKEENLIDLDAYNNLMNLLDRRIKGKKYFYKFDVEHKPTAVVAFSGGVDSSTSALISKNIFDVVGVTVYSNHIMHEEVKNHVKNLSKKLGIKHEFIDIDMDKIAKDIEKGKYHPCGRCHKAVEEAVINYAKNNGIKFVVFGDLLSVGYLSIIPMDDGLIRINMPAFLSLTKNENREILRQNNIEINLPYGCPLVKKAHEHKHMRKFTIQRILREVRAQVVDKDEGLKNILDMLNL